jgi:hypothetical protein
MCTSTVRFPIWVVLITAAAIPSCSIDATMAHRGFAGSVLGSVAMYVPVDGESIVVPGLAASTVPPPKALSQASTSLGPGGP